MAKRVRKSRAQNLRWTQMVEALHLMNFAFNNIRLYPPAHTEVVGVLTKLLETLNPILEEQDDIGFGFMDELLYIEGSMSIEETANNQMLVDRFVKCRVKYLIYMKGVTIEQLSTFFQILNTEAIKASAVTASEQLAQKGIETIHIVEAEVDDLASKSKSAKKRTLLDWYLKAMDVLKAAQEQLKTSVEADLKPLHRLVDDMTATMRSKGHEPYLLLPHLTRSLDPHLTHAVNVAIYSCALGDLQGLNSGQINNLVLGAFLHDLGRTTIPPEWTQDHTPLSEAERLIARQHCEWGFLLLCRQDELPPQFSLLAAHHHAGSGEGGYAPDSFHRLLAFADTYDLAMFSDRYYWRKSRLDRAFYKIVNSRGGRFDPLLVKLLVNCVGFYPVGCVVRLVDGRLGISVRPNAANPGRPKVWMFQETPPPPPPPEPVAEGTFVIAAPVPEEPPPVIVDLGELDEAGLAFKHAIAAVAGPPAGVDVGRLLDGKKEHLLSYQI